MKSIFQNLINYTTCNYVPMHMPGHKRNTELFQMDNPYGLDITEIDGFDNLHHPTGIIKEAMDRAAKMYGAGATYFLVSGSSIGLLSAISACTRRRDKILVARNCHKSVYNAIYMNELCPVYLYPESVSEQGINGPVTPERIADKLKENPDVSAVVITSPTYEGNVSDVRSIAKIVHSRGIPLIVDEAHGAHFMYHKDFPESALDQGADVVVQSIHKTLPAFTQTALLHLGKNAAQFVDQSRIERFLDIYQTTSPSYILMAGIDHCLCLLQEKGDVLFEEYVQRLHKLRQGIQELRMIRLYPSDDISKIVLFCDQNGWNGKEFYDILLKNYHIQLEMASEYYVIAMTAVGDKQEYYDRFLMALKECDQKIYESCIQNSQVPTEAIDQKQIKQQMEGQLLIHPQMMLTPFEAADQESELVLLKEAAGKICAEGITIYPPGIPTVFAGEVITSEIITRIEQALRTGLEVLGLTEPESNKETEVTQKSVRVNGIDETQSKMESVIGDTMQNKVEEVESIDRTDPIQAVSAEESKSTIVSVSTEEPKSKIVSVSTEEPKSTIVSVSTKDNQNAFNTIITQDTDRLEGVRVRCLK